MNLKKTMPFNKIKNISINDSIVKINDSNEIENEFSVTTIQKIYLKAHKQNKYLFYLSLLALIVVIVAFQVSLKLTLGITFLLIVSIFISELSWKQKKYTLYIKLYKNNNIYSIPFNTKRKEEVLKIIWEIKRLQFEASKATK